MNSKRLILLSLSLLLLLSAFSCGKKATEPGMETVSTPTFDPPGGTYSSDQEVSILCATVGVMILYTTDGTEPHSGSSVYTGPIPVLFKDYTTTIKAKAFRDEFKDSKTAKATYNMTGTVATPTFNLEGGTYYPAQNIILSCDTYGAIIRYTTDNSEPSSSSTIYSSPINVSSMTTIKAKAFKDGWTSSSTATATYAIGVLPMEMVLVPGGTFIMGDTRGGGSMTELPTHSVTLNSFYIGKYQVTQAQYANFIRPGSCWTQDHGLGDDYAAYCISWYDAILYCNLRSMAEGFTPVYSISGSTDPADWDSFSTGFSTIWNAAICNWDADGYRLPTEAEWEYAARGATNTPNYLYSGSDEINEVAWHLGNNSPDGIKPVGTKAPNGIGTYDMSGNVLEWCWEWYGSNYYLLSPLNNPQGPTSGYYRVQRGGSWFLIDYYSRVANIK